MNPSEKSVVAVVETLGNAAIAATQSLPPTVAMNPSLETPRRDDLLAQLAAANQWGKMLIVAQLMGVVGISLLVDWTKLHEQPLTNTVAIAAIVGPFAMSILTFWAQSKKEIGDLKEQTRFGQFDKHQLRTLFQDTLQRLQLPNHRLPVYIVADKMMNASMKHEGLGGLFKSLNGV